MAARVRKAEPCKPSVHGWAPYGTKGPCPTCGRRRCHGKAKGADGRCRLFPRDGSLVCRSHGANTRQARKAATERQAQAAVEKAEAKAAVLFGDAPQTDHREVALAEVGARYHAVLWFRAEIGASDGDERRAALSGLYAREKRLDEILRLCHDMKIDQQMQDLAMRDADRMDLLVHSLLGQLGHDPQDPAVRHAVRAALTVVEGGAPS
jgi:uncharacterized Zn finger protein (UPF0148 family)